MDFLPQREPSGTKALCALFESRAALQQSFNSSTRLNSAAAAGSKTGKDCPLQNWRSHNTHLKDTTIQVCDFSVIILYMIQHDNLPDFITLTVLSDAFLGSLYPRVKAMEEN